MSVVVIIAAVVDLIQEQTKKKIKEDQMAEFTPLSHLFIMKKQHLCFLTTSIHYH